MKSNLVKTAFVVVFLMILMGQGGTLLAKEPTSIPSAIESEFLVAEDYHQHFEFNVGSYNHYSIYGDRVQGHGEYGSFTAHYDDITFFICDQENFDKYEAGESYIWYSVLEDVVDGDFKFRYPSAGTWRRVFCNEDSIYAKDITFDLYYDQTPPDITLNIDTGATYGGIKEITVTASDVSFSVWKISLQYLRSTGWSSVKTEYNTESISYNWDTKDWSNGDVTWRVVAEDTVNNEAIVEKIVTVYNYVAPTTTPTTTPSPTEQPTPTGQPTTTNPTSPIEPLYISPGYMAIGAIALFVIVSGIWFKRKPKKYDKISDQRVDEISPPKAEPESKPAPDDTTTKTIERTTIEKLVLVICPFCGAKTEQGLTKCQLCGADL